MSDQEKANANENQCKRIIEELSALDDAMNKHQCYTCHYEFIDVVENFGTNILADAIAYLKAIDRDTAPTVDVVPVVRCKDCKHGQPMVYTHAERPCIMCSHLGSGFFARVFNPKWFCADGERREK